MTVLLLVLGALGVLGAGLGLGYRLPHARRAGASPDRVRRILLPFTGQAISRRAFEAAVRLARAENAILMPAFLARVPRNLPIDAPLAGQCTRAMPLMEAIEQQASLQGVAVDSRIARGRTLRDALRRLLESEQFDRVIVSATDSARTGLSGDDLEWLLSRVPAEVLILRPARDDVGRIEAGVLQGHF